MIFMPMQYAQHDTALKDSFILTTNKGDVKFQFCPRVQSDERHGVWDEVQSRGREPFANFMETSARKFTISITYICDGGQWSNKTIATQLQNLRGYYLMDSTASAPQLVAKVQMLGIGGGSPMTCRFIATNVKYSDTLVGNGNDAFPLRTDVTLSLALWTRGGGVSGSGGDVVNIDKLLGSVGKDWY